MNGDAPDEYELVDGPESDEPEADQPPTPSPKPSPRAAGQPLPRMWKAEPEDEPSSSPGRRRGADKASASANTFKAGGADEPGEKKALVEETPAFDTYEARQRARYVAGGLIAGVVGVGVYLVFQMFPGNPFPEEGVADENAVASAPVEPARRDLDLEARAMFVRAREFAKMGRPDEAVALLEKLIKSYKNTKTAGEAREALKRPGQNLPMFLDRPTVKADSPAEPAPAPVAPAPVVVARAPDVEVKGNATLVLPANPAEAAPSGVPATVNAAPEAAATPAVNLERRLPVGFTPKPEAGTSASGWPLMIVGDRDGAPMVFIPGGVFTMGDDRDGNYGGPEHKVNLSGYYIDQHEVTVRQFRLFLSETRYRGRPPGNWSTEDATGKPSTENMPMVMVNIGDATAYAEWAGKQLPTEAQWELAARSNDGRTYPWGDGPAGYARPRGSRQIDPIMSFPEDRSPFGVFDMAGNVYEWTTDSFDPGYYRSIASQVVVNPTGARPRLGKTDVVVKGGKSGAGAAREPMAAEKRLTYVGFRCAFQVEEPAVIAAPAPTPAAPAPAPPPGGQSPAPATAAPPPVPF